MQTTDIEYKCPYVGKCGSCHIGERSYQDELILKKQKVVDNIGKYCKKINDVIGMYYPYHYRNKIHAVFGKINGEVVSGNYALGTHTLIPTSNCLIEDKQASAIIKTVTELVKSFKLPIYDEDTGEGLMRHILIRKGMSTNQVMVVLVTAKMEFPHKKNLAEKLLELHPEITTIVQNINDKNTNMILGKTSRLLHGRGYIEDELMGLRFRISPASFYQVNSLQTQVLYKKIIEVAKLTGKENIIDAYCGTGTIGLCMHKNAERIIGIESNPAAVLDAKDNARKNKIGNALFLCVDATSYMSDLAKGKQEVDIIVLDPPRMGTTEEFIEAATSMKPKKIIYVSCNPETLGRDLALFKKKKYVAQEAWPIDMFSFTDHVETIVRLVPKDRPRRVKEISYEEEEYFRL